MAYKLKIFEQFFNPLHNDHWECEVIFSALRDSDIFESYEAIRHFLDEKMNISIGRRFNKKGVAYGTEIYDVEYDEDGYYEPDAIVCYYKIITEEVV